VNRKALLQKFTGKAFEELPTPSIIADVEAIDINLAKMDNFFKGSVCKLRPHFKSHKCVTLAKKQMEHENTIGITCAKLSEAEQLVWGGIKDVLIANQVIGMDKTRRLAQLNKHAIVRIAVDSETGIDQLDKAAQEIDLSIGVLIEVDIGMNRGGVKPGTPTMGLAEMISQKQGLTLDGLQSYEGHIITLEDYDERKRQVAEAMAPLLETKKMLEQKGFSLFISAGGTGTYDITGKIEGIDELQCGSYVLMDSAYNKIRSEFLYARYILATVISTRENTISTDVGLKGMGAEYGTPEIIGYPQAESLYVAEEHSVFKNIDVKIGDKLRLLPPHGCTTNNLYPFMWIARDDVIVDVWPIEGRGCLE